MSFSKFLKNQINSLKKGYLYRERIIIPEHIIDFSSNDYLGLKNHRETKENLKNNLEKLSLSSGASPLVSGYNIYQEELENLLSKIKCTEKCLVVGSGYLANVGLIQALANQKSVIFSDQFNHASIIDGIRLSKALKIIYPHKDINFLEDQLKKFKNYHLKFIITDGVFSMEGDITNYKELKYIADKYKAVIILDDAHATGIIGEGKGTIFHFNLKPDENTIQVGTLSKAIGSYGAFICGTSELITFLINSMRTQIFSTALSPVQNFISLENLKIMINQPHRRKKLLNNAQYLYKTASKNNINLTYFNTPIFTLQIGDNKKALKIRDFLLEKGIFVQAIRPPTVPEGTSRLRITVSYKHTKNDIDLLVKSLKESLELLI